MSEIENAEQRWQSALYALFMAHGSDIEKNPELGAFVAAVKDYAILLGHLPRPIGVSEAGVILYDGPSTTN